MTPAAPWTLGRSAAGPLAAVVVVGAGLRLWGILHGLREGFVYHQDAYYVVHDAWHHYLGASWRTGRFGPVYGGLVALAMGAVDTAGRLAGYPPAWSFELIGVAASLVAALLGTATIPVVYLLAARAYGRPAGLLAAAFLAVSPLHTFHSHYPYRDVPMVFFLAVTLAACLRLVDRPSLAALLLGLAAATATAALKTTGLAVIVPIVVALLLARHGMRRVVALGALGLLLAGVVTGAALGGIPTLPGFREWKLDSPLRAVGGLGRFVLLYLGSFGAGVGPGALAAVRVLGAWLGPATVAATGAAMLHAAWRHRPADLVLLAFVLPAFFVAAMFPWLDERYLVPLLPAGAALLARLAVDGWRAGRAWRLGRLAVGAVVGLLLGSALLQSAWQGVLLSLPDTRALAGRWLAAHVPRETRVRAEGYPPLGLETWPRVAWLDPRAPLERETAEADLLVTSSLEHGRYLDAPARYPREARFFQALPQAATLVKSVALQPLGFAHTTIDVYAPGPPRASDALPWLHLPRPFDPSWNAGVAFLDPGPYDRDDRTLALDGAQGQALVLVSRAPVEEIAVFVANGPEPSRVRVRVGWTSRRRALAPGELAVLRFRPSWRWPWRPALYRAEVGLLAEGASALVQIRSGPREIGATALGWGRAAEAVRDLERAILRSPADAEARLLLVSAYQATGRAAEARETAARLAPAVLDRYRRLADERARDDWDAGFRALSGLDPTRLRAALAVVVEAEDLAQGPGRVAGDPDAGGGLGVAYEPGRDRPGVVVNGPAALRLAGGAYRARFAVRAAPPAGDGPLLVLRVFAERQLLASRAVSARDLGAAGGYADVLVPFVHDDPRARVAVQVEALGPAGFTVDRVAIEPDLAATVRHRFRALPAR